MSRQEVLIYALWFVVCIAIGYYGRDVIDWVVSIFRRKP